MSPLPPGLLSTMTGFFQASPNFCASSRAIRSLPPPAAKAEIRRTVCVGSLTSAAPAPAPSNTLPTKAVRIPGKLGIPFLLLVFFLGLHATLADLAPPIADRAALHPAMRPNTAPLVRPVAPG